MEGRYIPIDVLLHILLRIPASTLQSLKYVSKVWFQAISDPDFAEAHHTHQSREKFGWSFIIGLRKDTLFIGEASSSNPNVPRRLFLPGAHGETHIYGSYKGLVLFQCGTSLHVANPITGENLKLPPFYGYNGSILSASMGCGRDHEMKVVVVARQRKEITTTTFICLVLTLGSRTWREVHIPVQGHLLEPFVEPILAAGALHLIYDTGILSLDLLHEKFHRTEANFLPNSELKNECHYFEWDGCFAVIFQLLGIMNYYYVVWVLKESEWKVFVEMDAAFLERLGCPCTVDRSSGLDIPCLLGTMRNGEVILFKQVNKGRMYLFAYDLGCQAVTSVTQFEDNFSLPYIEQDYLYFAAHVNSLISCSSYDSPNRIGLRGEGTLSRSAHMSSLISCSSYDSPKKIGLCGARTMSRSLAIKVGRTLRKLFRF